MKPPTVFPSRQRNPADPTRHQPGGGLFPRLDEAVDLTCRALQLPARQDLPPAWVVIVTILVVILVITGSQHLLLNLLRPPRAASSRPRRGTVARTARARAAAGSPTAPQPEPSAEPLTAAAHQATIETTAPCPSIPQPAEAAAPRAAILPGQTIRHRPRAGPSSRNPVPMQRVGMPILFHYRN